MNLTGKQLFEWWQEALTAAGPLQVNNLPKPWDALAEKLNGMMAGVGEAFYMPAGTVVEHDLSGRLIFKEKVQDDRARHQTTCPYRHGKGDCMC